MNEIRTGNTLKYVQKKHSMLMQELKSDEHYEKTETLAYGCHDPLNVHLPCCDDCGSKGQIQKVASKKIKWQVVCLGCEKTTRAPQKRPWQAALMWREINLGSQTYQELPLFGLSELSSSDAKLKMLGIRRNLELRKNITGLERTIANKLKKRSPGHQYQERLDAYLKWSFLAIGLIKHSKLIERNKSKPVH